MDIRTCGVTEPVENVKTKDMNKLYIDIGAMSKEEPSSMFSQGTVRSSAETMWNWQDVM